MSQDQVPETEPKFARFSRRIQGMMYDNMILVVIMAATLSLAIAAEGIGASRFVGFAGAAVILLYEPILVSLRGATVGHALRNLRVVDDRTHGNISFPKAVARYVIKLVLGVLSFLTMATTQRHQAFHDLLTGSTVRIRDESQAQSHHYQLARTEFLDGTMPSRLRRSMVILAYLLSATIALSIGTELVAGMLLSPGCLQDDKGCTNADQLVLSVIGVGLFAIWALIVVLGWRGKLPGARRSGNAASGEQAA